MYKKAVVLLIIIISLITSGNLTAQELTQNTTWSGTQIVEDIVIVPAGIVLNIESGTTVRMEEDTAIVVYGSLIAEGTEAEPIHFTRNDDNDEWERIMFIEAENSLLRHCIIEYADCEGRHQDYYQAGPRDYHEAVVILASHVDIENCTFQNLPDDSSNAEGDAIAVISDDEDHPGDASANIIGCQFLAIGQGVHTRFSYVLVEDCFFTDKNGDNDDVDLWGESDPPPMIRNNVFLNPDHDDMINPTKCSAVIVGNIIAGSDDHGVVLRDKCFPIMMNNIIYDCANAGIAIENTCEALLINNTIVDCGRGLRLLDLGRAGPPYYLTPGGGNATVINCIIWDCPRPVTLADSSNTDAEDRGSHITISYSDIEGGLDGVSNSGTYSTLTWGEGNIDTDPQFADEDDRDFRLKSQAERWEPDDKIWIQDDVTSPCIDTGDPNTPVAFEPFPNGAIINIGAFGGLAEASKSPSGLHAKYGGGTGDPCDPYLIYTIEQMNTIGTESEDWNKSFRLKVDIDLSGYSYDSALIAPDVDPCEPGFQGISFTGVFDGNGHTISNFNYTSEGNDRIGIFGHIDDPNARIENLGLIDPNIDVPTSNFVGSLAGYLRNGIINNCYVTGGSVSGNNFVGGLVGNNDPYGGINDSYSATTINGTNFVGGLVGACESDGGIIGSYSIATVNGTNFVGGLAGSCESDNGIEDSFSAGTVVGSHDVGGLVGSNDGNITSSYSTSIVSGFEDVGGLVGKNEYGIITNCFSNGTVDGSHSAGGLVGDNSGDIVASYSATAVNGTNIVGGLAGYSDGSIVTSYSTGPVTGDIDIGGLVGYNDNGTISNCYSVGAVDGNDTVGGLVGDSRIDPITGFWDIETSGQIRSSGGEGKSTAEMQMQSTFIDAGWDFVDETDNGTEDIWWINEGQDYPRLWWELTNP